MSFPKAPPWIDGEDWDAAAVNDLEQRTADAIPTITSPDQSITVGGTTADPTLELPASVLHGTMILPVPGTATTANALASGSGPWTESIAMPTVTVGDRAWLWVVAGSVPDTPTGWTLKASDASTDAKCYLFKRTINGTEGSTVSVVFQILPNQIAAVIVPVPGVTDGETYGTFTTHAGASSSLALSVTTPADDALVLYFQGSADASSTTATPPAGFAELADVNAQYGFRQGSIGYKTASVNAGTAVNETVSMTATAALAGVMVAIPSATYQALSKDAVLATGITAADLSAIVAGPDGRIDPAAQQPGMFGTWRSLGDNGVGGWMTAISYSIADPNRVLCGGDMLGVGLSTDGGDTWQATQGFASWEISSFTWHPTNPLHVWCGTMSGPYLSTDGGHAWTAKNSGMSTTDFPYSRATQKIVINPLTPTELWAFIGNFRSFKTSPSGGAQYYGRVYHSTDYGSTWTLSATVNLNSSIQSAAISKDASTLMLISAGNGVYRSTDSGSTWSQVFACANPRWVERHPTVSTTWYVAHDSDATNGHIFRSTDNGDTWATLGDNALLTSHGYRQVMMADDGQTMWACSDLYGYYSLNAGTNWTVYNPTLPPRGFAASFGVAFGALGMSRSAPTNVMFGTSDEIYRTRDGGRTLDSASTKMLADGSRTGRGYSGLLGYRTRFSRFTQGTMILCGSDAGSISLSTDNGVSWNRVTHSWDNYDGAYDAHFAGPTGKIIWVSLGQAGIFNGLGVSLNAGATFTIHAGTNGLPARFGGTRVTNAIQSTTKDGLTAIATIGGSIYRTVDGGTTWAVISGSAHAFQELVVDLTTLSADGSTTTVYGAGGNGLYVSTNGGTTWAAAAGSPLGVTMCMRIDPNDPTKVYMACWQPASNAGANQGLWRYDTGLGTFTRLFNNYSTRDVAVNPYDSSELVIATDDNPYHTISYGSGVWWSRDGGATWTQINTGLRMLRVYSIEFDPWQPGRVVCGANGGGFWVTNLPAGGTAMDERGSRLPVGQRAVDPGYGEKEFGYPDLGTLLPGPLDNSFGKTPRLYAAQAPGAMVATTQATTYQFALEDAGTCVESTSASGVTFTLPANATVAFPVGTYIEVFQYGAGQVTIAGAGGVTLRSDSGATKTNVQYATIGLRQRAANEWVLSGDLTT